MITVSVQHDGEEIARIRYTKIRTGQGLVDYLAQVGVERLGSESAVGMHTVEVTDWNRNQYNVLALILATLEQLSNRDLMLEKDTTEEHFKRRKNGLRSLIGRLR